MTIRVNGQPIPDAAVRFEFDRLVKFFSDHISPEEIRKQTGSLWSKAREQAIGARLLILDAARLDLHVPGDYVDSRIEEMIAMAGGREAFDAILSQQRLTEAALRKSIVEGRKTDLLVEKITADAPDPTEEELESHYRRHAAEFVRADRAQARHILVKPASDGNEDREAARSRLDEIRQRVAEGADFAGQAAAFSDCPSGRKTGGSMGWFSRGTLLPQMDKAVFSMNVNEISNIVESPLGFHLIQKTAHEKGGATPFEDAREKIRDFLRHSRRGEIIAAYVAELRKKATIETD